MIGFCRNFLFIRPVLLKCTKLMLSPKRSIIRKIIVSPAPNDPHTDKVRSIRSEQFDQFSGNLLRYPIFLAILENQVGDHPMND